MGARTHLLLSIVIVLNIFPMWGEGDDSVNFYLYTKSNPKKAQELYTDNIKSVITSYFDWRNPTRILVHGWMSNSDMEVNTLIRDAFFSIGPYNIVFVNWEKRSVAPYEQAVMYVPDVGKEVAEFVDFMARYGFLRPQNLTIIGHSLGAHVCGNAGRRVKSGQLHSIIGLDPASPMFPYSTSHVRLFPSDAYYVETIQTNGQVAGFDKPIGKATFYPNGGQTQPGCGFDTIGTCSHNRSYKYYAEAIKMNGFPSIKCPNYSKAIDKNCGHLLSQTVRMGAPSNADIASGAYYVPIEPNPPYGVHLTG